MSGALPEEGTLDSESGSAGKGGLRKEDIFYQIPVVSYFSLK